MFSSDVSARGMDFPDVSHVVQIGITTKEQYIHRLGRTARAGKAGAGWIILCPFEERHMKRQLKDLPIKNIVGYEFSRNLFRRAPSLRFACGMLVSRASPTV